MGRRLVAGRPVSPVTLALLAWASAPRAAPGVCVASDRGSRPLAVPSGGAALAPPAQAAGHAGRGRGAARRLPGAQHKSMAQSP